jgi:hypothetical protein
MAIDSTRTDYCPLGHRCENCGATSPSLRVATRAVLGATLCLTLCENCAMNGRLPSVMLATAERLVEQHRAHLERVPWILPGGCGGPGSCSIVMI